MSTRCRDEKWEAYCLQAVMIDPDSDSRAPGLNPRQAGPCVPLSVARSLGASTPWKCWRSYRREGALDKRRFVMVRSTSGCMLETDQPFKEIPDPRTSFLEHRWQGREVNGNVVSVSQSEKERDRERERDRSGERSGVGVEVGSSIESAERRHLKYGASCD